MTQYSCPNCGAAVEPELHFIKMMNCTSCGTTLFLEDESARLAGEAGIMHDAPLLFGLNDQVTLLGTTCKIMGHVRYSYGRGFWDEFWAIDQEQRSVWISVDEGDVILQRPVPKTDWPTDHDRKLGSVFSFFGEDYTVQEVESALCVAVRGSFDEAITTGDTHLFLNAQSDNNQLLSGEFWTGGESWFVGRWVDPFDVEAIRAP